MLAVVIALWSSAALGQENEPKPDASSGTRAKVIAANDVSWRDAPGLPAGAQIAVLDGDPTKEGSFTLRLKIPPGYRIPPHTHSTAERITVISGVVQLGIGDKFDGTAGRELKAGDFAVVPPGVPHFAWSEGEAVLQIQSEGPFQRKYIESGDERTDAKK
jgi:quercetin dioxygenase-like cupin family protein